MDFSHATAMSVVPDFRRRVLESEARKFAQGSVPPRTRWNFGLTYWDGVYKELERVIWRAAYFKRAQRMKRMVSGTV